MSKEQDNKIDFQLDEVISPIFGDDYKNRVINRKDDIKSSNSRGLNYIEQHIEMELLQKNQLDKNKEYQTKVKTDNDVLKQYQKNKSKQEIIESLPSNYLDFRDNLLDNSNDLTMINELSQDNTISQIVNDIFEKE